MRQLVGDEILLMAMATEPDWILDMSQTYTDLILTEYQAVLNTGIPIHGIWVYGDVGYNRGPFFSPQMYRELIAPDHRRLSGFAHQNNLKLIYHTDGDVRKLIDDFVVNGFDCLQPLEAKANMDVRQLSPQYGKKLSFFGNINMMVASLNDRNQLEDEIKTKLKAGMAHHGYAYHSDHSVPPSVHWKTYQWIIELIDQYGNYA